MGINLLIIFDFQISLCKSVLSPIPCKRFIFLGTRHMSQSEHNQTAWKAAVDWITREHEGVLDEQGQLQLADWLGASEEHRNAYKEASRIWLALAFIPPVHDVE